MLSIQATSVANDGVRTENTEASAAAIFASTSRSVCKRCKRKIGSKRNVRERERKRERTKERESDRRGIVFVTYGIIETRNAVNHDVLENVRHNDVELLDGEGRAIREDACENAFALCELNEVEKRWTGRSAFLLRRCGNGSRSGRRNRTELSHRNGQLRTSKLRAKRRLYGGSHGAETFTCRTKRRDGYYYYCNKHKTKNIKVSQSVIISVIL